MNSYNSEMWDTFNPDDYGVSPAHSNDSDYQLYRNNKYETNVNAFDEFNPQEDHETLTPADAEYDEYKRRYDDFAKSTGLINSIPNTHIPLAWTMRNIDNQRSRDYAKAAAGAISYQQAKKNYEDNLNKAAAKYGYTPQDILDWQARDWRGFITGTTEVLNDMRDVTLESGLTAAGVIGSSTAVGGLTGGAPGAVAGAVRGIAISKTAVVPIATFADTTIKEGGAFIADYVESHPNMTKDEEKQLKLTALGVGILNGAIEAGTAAVLLPYVKNVALQIPGVSKITEKVLAPVEKKAIASVQNYLATSAGRQFLYDTAKIMGLEITTEETQEIINMVGELSLGENISPEEAGERLVKTATGTIQGVGPLALLGAAGSVRARRQASRQMADNINKQIERMQNAPEAELSVSARIVPSTEGQNTETQGPIEFKEKTDSTLKSEKAKLEIQRNEIDGNIKSIESQIKNAKDLGYSDQQVNGLQEQLKSLSVEKEQADNQYRNIEEEQEIRSAQKEIDANIESTNTKIDKTTTALENNKTLLDKKQSELKVLEQKVKKSEGTEATSYRKKISAVKNQITKLEQENEKYNKQLDSLESEQEALMSNRDILESREGYAEILEQRKISKTSETKKKTTSPKIPTEKDIQEAIKNKDTEQIKKLNRLRRRAIKKELGTFIQGAKAGIKSQITETKNIRRELSNALRLAGIKRSELGMFDSVLKRIVTVSDLIQNQKNIENKVDEVLEKRSKQEALKMTERLRKLAKPLKSKTPKGKMTADIQNKVNRLFSFTQKTALETGFDINDLMRRYGQNSNATLNKSEKAQILIAQNNEQIANNDIRIAELEKSMKENPIEWDGKNLKRKDSINSKNVETSVNSFEVDKHKPNEQTEKVVQYAKDLLAKSLNAVNMKYLFNDLNIKISKDAFVDSVNKVQGSYNNQTKTIKITSKSLTSIFHEVGHYFDYKLAQIFNEKATRSLSADRTNMTDPNVKRTLQKLNTLIKTEQLRLSKIPAFKKLSSENKEYLTSPSEIFARLFHAEVNKINKMDLPLELDLVSGITDTVPNKTLNDFESVLNDLANYKAYGMEAFELKNQNENLLKENENIINNEAEINKIARLHNLPEDISELIYELELASDLKNKTADQIYAFNKYVAELISEGRDVNKIKQEAAKAEREKNIAEAREAFDILKPKDTKGRLKAKPIMTMYNSVTADLYSSINLFFGKKVADKYNILYEETQKQSYVFRKKQDFLKKASEIYGLNKSVKGLFGLGSILKDYLKQTMTVKVNLNGKLEDRRINRLNIIGFWIYKQNELGNARLNNSYSQEEQNRMFGILSEEDIKFAESLIEAVDTYNEVNQIFREERGIDMPKRSNYFPFVSEREILDIPSFLENNFGVQMGLPSFTKTVQESASVELKPINPVSVLFSHLEDVGNYVYLHKKANMINRVFKDKGIQNAISFNYGEINLKAFNAKIDSLSMTDRHKVHSLLMEKIDQLVSNYVVAVLALKPTIAIKQFLSFINYAEDVPSFYFSKYLAEFMVNPKKAIDFMIQDDYLKSRFAEGMSTVELAKAIEQSEYSKTKRLTDFLTLNIRLGDMSAIVFGGYAQVKYLMNQKGLSKEEAFKRFRVSTVSTQQFNANSSLSNSQMYAKRNPLVRMVFAFTNTPYQYTRKTVDTIYQLKRGEIKAGQAAKRLFIYQALNPWLYRIATSLSPVAFLLGSLYDDEAKKEEALYELFVNDIFGGLLIGNGDLVNVGISETVFRAMTGQQAYRTKGYPQLDNFVKMVYTVPELIKNTYDLFVSHEKELKDIDVEDYIEAAQAFSEFSGYPVKYAMTAASGLSDIFKLGSDAEFKPFTGALKLLGYTEKRSEWVTEDYGL